MTVELPLNTSFSVSGTRLLELPRCLDLELLRAMHPSCASLTAMEMRLYGGVPSLIYSVKAGGVSIMDHFESMFSKIK